MVVVVVAGLVDVDVGGADVVGVLWVVVGTLGVVGVEVGTVGTVDETTGRGVGCPGTVVMTGGRDGANGETKAAAVTVAACAVGNITTLATPVVVLASPP